MKPRHTRIGIPVLLFLLSGCGGGPSGPTAPTGPQSFLAGTWRGTMTIQPNPTAPQPPMPVIGAVTWTFEVVPQTNLQTFRTTIQSAERMAADHVDDVDVDDSWEHAAGPDQHTGRV